MQRVLGFQDSKVNNQAINAFLINSRLNQIFFLMTPKNLKNMQI